MTHDPYDEAIQAGAAALVKPYRDPETVHAFVEAFPVLAATRVINAALPHLRATVLAEAIPPGPCPANTDLMNPVPDGPMHLRALCDLRAGHAGQHEASDTVWGHYRWSERMPEHDEDPWYAQARCGHELEGKPGVRCWAMPGHHDAHSNGALSWNDCNEVMQR